MTLTLYHAPGSCSRASHIALREAGAEFNLHTIDFSTAEQRSDAYHRINPKGRVPALATPNGILTETPAILLFVVQMYPDHALAPLADPFELARMQGLNNYLCATVHVAHAHSRRPERWADTDSAREDMQRKAPEVMADCFQTIEQAFIDGPWAIGDSYSVADPYLFTISQWLPFHQLDIASYPRIAEHSERMQERAAVVEALQAEAATG